MSGGVEGSYLLSGVAWGLVTCKTSPVVFSVPSLLLSSGFGELHTFGRVTHRTSTSPYPRGSHSLAKMLAHTWLLILLW